MTLIKRADAIDALCHNCAYYTDAQCKTDSGYWCESGAMIREDIPSADAEWIPVSERLPSEKDGHVLVTKRGEVRVAAYSEFSGTWYVGEMCAVGGEDPIAWMPLPEPYKAESEEV